MSLLTPRPKRYVPRHSTREPFRAWDAREVVDLTAASGSPAVVLASVLSGLEDLVAPEAPDRRREGATAG